MTRPNPPCDHSIITTSRILQNAISYLIDRYVQESYPVLFTNNNTSVDDISLTLINLLTLCINRREIESRRLNLPYQSPVAEAFCTSTAMYSIDRHV